MPSRRQLLEQSFRLGGLLLLLGESVGAAHADVAGYNATAFDAKTLAEALKALGLGLPQASKDVSLTAPDIAENGAVVQVGVATALQGVKRLLILVEKNPAVLSAAFEMSESIEPAVTTRVKMGQTSNVHGVAVLADGRVLFATREVKVTLGGCGG
jgi:sulfur-oxidizing protein SoxY